MYGPLFFSFGGGGGRVEGGILFVGQALTRMWEWTLFRAGLDQEKMCQVHTSGIVIHLFRCSGRDQRRQYSTPSDMFSNLGTASLLPPYLSTYGVG